MNSTVIKNNYAIKYPSLHPSLTLLMLFLATIIIFWPGIMSPDAVTQYLEAKAGIYTDHHPPIMAFIWKHLDQIYPGSGLLWILHLALLYLAAAIFSVIFNRNKLKWLFALFPLIPHVATYSLLVVKDLAFAYSYLLSGAIIAYLITAPKQAVKAVNGKIKFIFLPIIILLLFYGTAAKFQAKWLLLPFTICTIYAYSNKWCYKTIGTGVILFFLILQGIYQFNNWLVPNQQKSNSWELVKLYDLAAISLKIQQPLFPNFILQHPNFSMANLQANFVPNKVDPLVFAKEKILIKSNSLAEQQELLSIWHKAVRQYPLAYLSHRIRLWTYNVNTAPSSLYHPYYYFQDTKIGKFLAIPLVYQVTGLIYSVVSIMLKFVWLLPLLIFYSYLGIVTRHKTKAAVPLLLFSLSSIILLTVLLFCSMAGVARYTYICACLVHASHGFAYWCWQSRKQPGLLSNNQLPTLGQCTIIFKNNFKHHG